MCENFKAKPSPESYRILQTNPSKKWQCEIYHSRVNKQHIYLAVGAQQERNEMGGF